MHRAWSLALTGVKSRPRDGVLRNTTTAAAPDYTARAEQSIRRAVLLAQKDECHLV